LADTRYRIKVFCPFGCQPGSETSENNQGTSTLTTAVSNGGVIYFHSYVDQIHTPDCVWVASIQNTSTATAFVYWLQ
jgi:hypothetical protein